MDYYQTMQHLHVVDVAQVVRVVVFAALAGCAAIGTLTRWVRG